MVVMEEAVVEGAAASEDVNLVELMNARARSYGMLARLFREEVDLPPIRTSRCTRPSAGCSCRRPAPRCSPRCAKTS